MVLNFFDLLSARGLLVDLGTENLLSVPGTFKFQVQQIS